MSPRMMAGGLGWTYLSGTVVGRCCALPGLCMLPAPQGVATGVGWLPAWKIKLSFPQTSPGAGDRILPVPAQGCSPLRPGGSTQLI